MAEEQMVRVFWVWRLEEVRTRESYGLGRPSVAEAYSLERAAQEFAELCMGEDAARIRVLDPHTGESAVFDVSVTRSVELVRVGEEEAS